jgi:GNAT superfamily N-acetyltransferase
MQIEKIIHSVGASIYLKHKGRGLWFYCFSVPRKLRGKGIAKKAMSELCNFADKNKIILRGFAVAMDKYTEQKRLEMFYSRFGFKIKNRRMTRKPKNHKEMLWQK